jgi:hypothetical protein
MHACILISAFELTDFHKTLYAYYATAGYCNAVRFKFVMPAITTNQIINSYSTKFLGLFIDSSVS